MLTMLIVDCVRGAEGKKQVSPVTSQSKCRVCAQRITDKFRLHRGRKFCSRACLRKYGSNAIEPTVPAESQTPRKPTAEELTATTEHTRTDQRNTDAWQDACQSPQEMVIALYLDPAKNHAVFVSVPCFLLSW